MKHLYKPLLKRTAETIIDSVFQRDTDSLHQFAASVQHTRYWQPFEVDSLLPVSRMYKKLDSMPEILLPLGNGMDTTARRSSSVDYYITSRNLFEGQQYYHSAKIGDAGPCRGSLQNDTLLISIGSHMGFGDIGFNIFVARGRFTTMPYYSRCVITDNALKPLNVPLWQRLVINKKS